MAWYEDLAPCGIEDCFKAVGWLEKGHPFKTGEVSEAVFEKLCQLLVDPWNLAYSPGFEPCGFCRFSGGNGAVSFKSFRFSGTSNLILLVPGQGVIYEAPSAIAHYIDAHSYQPPAEFLEAVMACPPMRSMAYFKAILANGGRELVKGLTSAPEE